MKHDYENLSFTATEVCYNISKFNIRNPKIVKFYVPVLMPFIPMGKPRISDKIVSDSHTINKERMFNCSGSIEFLNYIEIEVPKHVTAQIEDIKLVHFRRTIKILGKGPEEAEEKYREENENILRENNKILDNIYKSLEQINLNIESQNKNIELDNLRDQEGDGDNGGDDKDNESPPHDTMTGGPSGTVVENQPPVSGGSTSNGSVGFSIGRSSNISTNDFEDIPEEDYMDNILPVSALISGSRKSLTLLELLGPGNRSMKTPKFHKCTSIPYRVLNKVRTRKTYFTPNKKNIAKLGIEFLICFIGGDIFQPRIFSLGNIEPKLLKDNKRYAIIDMDSDIEYDKIKGKMDLDILGLDGKAINDINKEGEDVVDTRPYGPEADNQSTPTTNDTDIEEDNDDEEGDE